MSTKHTQGPWVEDEKHTVGAQAIIGDGLQLIALVYGATAEERDANARLIAAAPDLLRAAQLSLHSLEGLGWTDRPLTLEVRAAISKAESGQ